MCILIVTIRNYKPMFLDIGPQLECKEGVRGHYLALP